MAWHATPRLPDIARTKSGVRSLSGAIPPIVASEGNGGRLGNYADRTARGLLADKRLSLGNDPDRDGTDIVPTRFSAAAAAVHLAGPRPPRATHVLARSPDLHAGDGDDDISRPEYAYPVTGNSDALYDLSEPEPSQSFALIASSAAGYTMVPLGSTCAPGVSFAGSTLPLPMMCMTGTPCAKR